jgi:hypothetical protein
MPRKLELNLKLASADWLRVKSIDQLGADDFSNFFKKWRNGVHAKSVHMN